VIITDVGCISDTLPKVVNLTNPPVAGMTATTTRCVGKPVTFYDASTVPTGSTLVEWTWDFGDGSPLVVAATGANQVHTYAAAGTYTAKLRVKTATGCYSTEFPFPVTIHVNPVVNFSFPNICLPSGAAQFTNNTTISDGTQALLTYNWDFGDGSPNVSTVSPLHTYTGTGPYTATLTATSNNGCTENLPRLVNTIYAQADGEFTVNPENCVGAVTSFTSTSNPLAGNTTAQWHWDFGDGTPNSTVQNPVHTYATPGTYSVKHWIVTDKGCNSDTAIHPVTVNQLPTADFNFTGPVCETRALNFTDNSVPNAGSLNSWSWNFGDGSPVSPLQNPTHTYALPGTYTVTLQVTTNKGCVSTVLPLQVVVNRLPEAGFSFPESCQDDAVQFTDTSKVTGGSITQWSWNFGDASALSTLQNPQHNYAAPGVYNVTLTATTNNGCAATTSASVTVNGDTPVADFTTLNPASLCSSDSIAIQDISTVNFGSVTKIEIYWDNGGAPAVFDTDDLPASGKIYKHKYPTLQTTQTYTIRYRAYSGVTCVDDMIRPITVNATPRVLFNPIPDICLDAAAYTITQASETGGVPGSGLFTGPGVSPAGLFNPAAAGPGTHTIKYMYTATAAGCVDSASRTIKVLAPPVTDFSIGSPVCETKAVSFTSTSSATEGTLTTWTWNFGDGSPQVVRNNPAAVSHTYAGYGLYTVTLSVLTSDGCSNTPKTVNLQVNPQPKASFTLPASACLPNANISPVSNSSIADGSQASFGYLWNFGDPGSGTVNTSTSPSPTHTYVSTGPFNINLQITSGAGCKHDTTITLNTIHPQPLAAFDVDKVDVCVGGSFTFTDNSNPLDGTITQYNWAMDDGNTRDVPSFTYTYSTPRVYNVSLVITNSHGCRSTTAVKPMSVNPYPGVSAGPDKVVLEGGQVMLTPSQNAGPNVTYLWAPPTGLNDPTSGFPLASPAEDITYTLTVTTDKGCSASDQVFVKVLKSPAIPNIFSPNGDGVHDKWIIQYLDTYPGCTVDIFNRYGQVVFHSVGYTTPWDGTVNGKPVPVGTYYYIVNPKNGRKQMTGYLDVIR
jgi:gliding motility-associated-like protein